MGVVRRNVVPFASGLAGVMVGSMMFGGVVYAANGGSFILGKSNSATATTTLTNSAGTPLSLRAKAGTPPLRVNTTAKVPNLNADRLDGLDSTAFRRAGARAADSAALEGKNLAQVADTVRNGIGLQFQRVSAPLVAVAGTTGIASNSAATGFVGRIQGTVTVSCSGVSAPVITANVLSPNGDLTLLGTSTTTFCNQPWTVSADVKVATGDRLAVIVTGQPVSGVSVSLSSGVVGPGAL